MNLAKNESKEKREVVDVSFDIALIFKSLFAISEVLGGISLFFLTPSRLNSTIGWIVKVKGNIDQDSQSMLMNMLINFGNNFTVSTQYLLAIYLLSHGLIKLVTLALLWKKVLWAYPLSIVVFVGFIIYQMREFLTTHSFFMIFVTVVDVIMIVLTILEYRNIKSAK
ncbi:MULTISPECIES: DUF2127 domain-containing protein [unclassified Lactococcus]|uniref:DUF2127 domain-containing protein n=1 Tax=unclassified Lactococcus TaxID=2643510 RepID=UPI0011C79129|nr:MULTISPECIES: DUF2127 domain-containing protein [unclassified Lactococcus]MQW24047.1 DUF2127 domain-containing protein [Lactococcus sp. dk101]TXK36657.1 DUF2127 domain-containing protein [Lactococcus sp. dk310]TXK46426.1 DUF2127 domain-containing protein [Lactococcus sp. dk322]